MPVVNRTVISRSLNWKPITVAVISQMYPCFFYIYIYFLPVEDLHKRTRTDINANAKEVHIFPSLSLSHVISIMYSITNSLKSTSLSFLHKQAEVAILPCVFI